MALINIPIPDMDNARSTDEKINLLLDAYYLLRKELEYGLQNLDLSNLNDDFKRWLEMLPDTVIITQGIVTETLYADRAYIAELTVDQLETSKKVQKYLAGDTSDVNYIKIFEQYIQFITSSTDGSQTEQVKDRHDNYLYWTDGTYKATTTEVTSRPVYQYVYTNQKKAEIAFVYDGINYNPQIILGLGDGVIPGVSGIVRIYKTAAGVKIEYKANNTGHERSIVIDDTGVHVVMEGYQAGAIVRNIIVTTEEPTASMGNVNDIIIQIEG